MRLVLMLVSTLCIAGGTSRLILALMLFVAAPKADAVVVVEDDDCGNACGRSELVGDDDNFSLSENVLALKLFPLGAADGDISLSFIAKEFERTQALVTLRRFIDVGRPDFDRAPDGFPLRSILLLLLLKLSSVSGAVSIPPAWVCCSCSNCVHSSCYVKMSRVKNQGVMQSCAWLNP